VAGLAIGGDVNLRMAQTCTKMSQNGIVEFLATLVTITLVNENAETIVGLERPK
jgi:hypothetical protein